MIKLKKLLIKEETEKIWQIVHEPSDEIIGFTKAMSSEEALEKFYKHDRKHFPNTFMDKKEFRAIESDQSEVNKYKQYWGKKAQSKSWVADMAKLALKNVDIK